MDEISTYKTFIMKKGSGQNASYEKLIDIKSFPDLGGAPESIEVTTLSDGAHRYIPGLKASGQLEFPSNYSSTVFDTLSALAGEELDLAIWFGGTESNGVVTPTGSDGKFNFKGYVDVFVAGGGVGDPVEMTTVVTPSSPIVKASV